MTRELDAVLVSKSATNLSFDLYTTWPRPSGRMRRGSPYQRVPVVLPRGGKVDVAHLLGCSTAEARAVIEATPMVRRYVQKGLLEVQ